MKSNNSQGNPYHDQGGKFTTGGNQGSGGSAQAEQKLAKKGFVSDPLMDLFGSLMDTANKLYPNRAKQTQTKNKLDEMGFSGEEQPNTDPLSKESLGELFDKYDGNEDAVLDELRTKGIDISNSDLQGVVESFSASWSPSGGKMGGN